MDIMEKYKFDTTILPDGVRLVIKPYALSANRYETDEESVFVWV